MTRVQSDEEGGLCFSPDFRQQGSTRSLEGTIRLALSRVGRRCLVSYTSGTSKLDLRTIMTYLKNQLAHNGHCFEQSHSHSP